MIVKERILALRLVAKIIRRPEYAENIGLTAITAHSPNEDTTLKVKEFNKQES